MVYKLFIINLKSIVFEKRAIVLRIVILVVIRRVVEVFNNQTPVLVFFSKINRAIHALHSLFFQPLFSLIKKDKCRLFIINAFKKSNTTYRSIIFLIGFMVDKSCIFTFFFPFFFYFHSITFSFPKNLIFFWLNYSFYFFFVFWIQFEFF